MKKIILAILLVSLPAKAYCEPSSMAGAGSAKCSIYNSQTREIQGSIFLPWVQGFLTALNFYNEVKLKFFVDLANPNFNYIMQEKLLDVLCAENPNEDVYVQAIKIQKEMEKMGLIVHTN